MGGEEGKSHQLETGVSKLSSMWPRERGGGADDTSADTSSGITSKFRADIRKGNNRQQHNLMRNYGDFE